MGKQGVIMKPSGDKSGAEGTVGGGKVWTPSSARVHVFHQVMPIVAMVVSSYIWFFSTISVLIQGSMSKNVPENISMQDFGWHRNYEYIFGTIVLIGGIYTIAVFVKYSIHPIRIIATIIFFGVVISCSITSIFMKENITSINLWAKQYGYEFPSQNLSDMGRYPYEASAINLETGEEEILVLKEVNGNLAWEGMKQLTNEIDVPIPTVQADFEEENIVDETTGIEYKVEEKNGEMVLIPVE